METLHFDGLILAFVSLAIIAVFHPIVIKAEYYFGKRCWPVFFIFGCVAILASMTVQMTVMSSILGFLGCTLMWCIKELFDQEKRVKRGWFPKREDR